MCEREREGGGEEERESHHEAPSFLSMQKILGRKLLEGHEPLCFRTSPRLCPTHLA